MTGATIEDLNGLVAHLDVEDVPFGATIWDGGKLYQVERAEEDWAGTYLVCQPLDGGDVYYVRHRACVILYGAID